MPEEHPGRDGLYEWNEKKKHETDRIFFCVEIAATRRHRRRCPTGKDKNSPLVKHVNSSTLMCSPAGNVPRVSARKCCTLH